MPSNPFHEPTQASALPRYHQGRRLMGGRYTLVRRLGRGGMGEVWLAQDNELTGQRALKFAPQELVADAKSAAMLKHEVIAGISLAHPHVVRVYDFAQDPDEGESAVVMEVVDGHSLADLQAMRIAEREHGCFDPEEILPWLRQACAALEYAHGEGRVHRDLKPQNLLIEKATSRLKIADFGISRRIGESMSRLSGRDSSGTRPYMSPQQLDGQRARPADDIYGLGATIYDLLTGVPPFEGGDLETQIHLKTPPSIRQRRHDLGADDMQPVPEAWEALVRQCLEKKPEDRPASATALLALLEQAAQSSVGVGRTKPLKQAVVVVPAEPPPPPAAEKTKPPTQAVVVVPADPTLPPVTERAKPQPQAARPPQTARPPLRPITPIPPSQTVAAESGWTSPRRPVGNPRRQGPSMAWWVLMVLGLMVLGGLGYGAWRIRSRTASYTPRELPKFVQTEVKPQGPSEEELRKAAVQEEVRRQREEGKAAKEKQKNTVKVFRNEKAKPVDDDEHGPKPGAPASKTVVEDTPRPPASMPAATTPLEERPLVEPSPPVVSPVNPRPVRVQRATQLTDEAPAGQDQQGLPQSPPPSPQPPPRAVAVEDASAAEAPAAGPLVKMARAATAQDLASEGLVEKPAGEAARPIARATIKVRLQGRVVTLTVTRDPAQATASLPYGNDLGMLFLPVKGTNVLFSLFETRSKDFARYPQPPADNPVAAAQQDEWRTFKYKEIDVGRGEGEAAGQSDHPVMKVTWQQSVGFCDWLTTSDQAPRPSHRRYRLPTDAEWSAAIGLLEEHGDTPMEKFRNSKFRPPVYPWGDQPQPKDRAGNYADLAWQRAGVTTHPVIEGYDDGFATTAPVGSFAPVNGLYDLSGNVWEWCQDEVEEKGRLCHIARGGCWATYKAESLESAAREVKDETYAPSDYGFRCVLAPE